MAKKKALFICVHNSARSQIAEAFLKQLAGDRLEVKSAGLEPGKLNPLAIEVMREMALISLRIKQKAYLIFTSKVKNTIMLLRFATNRKQLNVLFSQERLSRCIGVLMIRLGSMARKKKSCSRHE